MRSHRGHLLVDVALIAWVVTWVAMGVRVADEVRGLSELSTTVIDVGAAVESAGAALGSLKDIPFAGDRVAGPSEEVREAGRSAVDSGRSSRKSIRELSTLLGVAVAIIPSVPLIALYAPLRLAWTRERRALARAWRDPRNRPALTRLLARRALVTSGYDELLRHERTEAGIAADADRLAALELRRMRIPTRPETTQRT